MPLKLMDQFTYIGSNISSTKSDINTLQAKAWTAIDRSSIIWKSDFPDKIKWNFFEAVTILLYGCITWTLTKSIEKKQDGNYTKRLQTNPGSNSSRKKQLYAHLPPISRLIAFHIALIPLGKVWIQLFSLQLWVNSRADLVLQPLVRQLV